MEITQTEQGLWRAGSQRGRGLQLDWQTASKVGYVSCSALHKEPWRSALLLTLLACAPRSAAVCVRIAMCICLATYVCVRARAPRSAQHATSRSLHQSWHVLPQTWRTWPRSGQAQCSHSRHPSWPPCMYQLQICGFDASGGINAYERALPVALPVELAAPAGGAPSCPCHCHCTGLG